MEFTVKDHLLYQSGQQVPFIESPNISGEIVPALIVIHYTGDNSAEGAISWLCAPQAQVSAHLVVRKDGSVVQLVPFNIKAWHAGRSAYYGEANLPHGRGVNGFSIGIENVGIGDEWPDAQVEANRAIIAAIFEAYPIQDVVGHEDVAPGRKTDPGPLYPWNRVTG